MTGSPASSPTRFGNTRTLLFAALYAGLAAVCYSTALIQPNTATVWVPSGFACGLLIAEGIERWRAVALGSLAFNLAINLEAVPDFGFAPAILVAIAVALGNIGESVSTAYFARRCARGVHFAEKLATTVIFTLVIAPLTPLISVFLGVFASRIAGFPSSGTLSEVSLTWYIANYVGIIVFTGLTIKALKSVRQWPRLVRVGEALLLAICLGFAGQSLGGYFGNGWIFDWVQSYMIVPLLLWACFRFGATGGLFSLAFITVIAVFGTLRGFSAFPAPSPWRALIDLQIFLGMLSVTTLTLSAALHEIAAFRATLEERVRDRTAEIEGYMREREIFTTLVAHDLQSPLYGIRNAIRATRDDIDHHRIDQNELKQTLIVMDETCTALADRAKSLIAAADPHAAPAPRDLWGIVREIASLQGVQLGENARLRYQGPADLDIPNAADIELILATLIDNALCYSPEPTPVTVTAAVTDREISVSVADLGAGVPAEISAKLFYSAVRSGGANGGRAGIGLFLAAEKARRLNIKLGYGPNAPRGSVFTMRVPV
ncbi:Signal transduction histidine kinase [Fulvimarina manganoxydans]|uniref:histidine kinase n=1 Tax=Fulvimarina manganoxydans TaxID=937218 RepID=A0A1W2DF11_9HYPH|nr:MASE1 domain-containing protein [Fulvimarina manganoxydans]SMC96051.1 Signal transduction histidine kinase [Fulvimarina manganoxydans]